MKLYRIGVFCLLAIWSLSTCNRENPLSVPPQKMIEVLVDVHVAEAALQNLSSDTKDSLMVVYYDQIYDIHGITATQFEQDMTYIKRHPKTMEKIYEKVLEQLNKLEAETQ